VRVLAIDPGKHAIGLSVWDDGRLTRVLFVPVESWQGIAVDLRDWAADEIVCEIPQVYRTGLQKGDQGDLIAVALVAGACLSCAAVATAVRPQAWKGQVPKEIHNERVLKRVEREAASVFAELMKIPKTKRHNVIDAVGIGQWYFDRKRA
jgi:hypothetical protein